MVRDQERVMKIDQPSTLPGSGTLSHGLEPCPSCSQPWPQIMDEQYWAVQEDLTALVLLLCFQELLGLPVSIHARLAQSTSSQKPGYN